jgi:surfeit locus 1 family protein
MSKIPCTVHPLRLTPTPRRNPGGLPEGGRTRINFPNDHLQYAITWFGLAAALAGVFDAWQRLR